MLSILKLLRNSPFVTEYKILEFVEDKVPEYYYYIKIEITLKDGSILYIREYNSESQRNYSYHIQKNNKLVIRWDNAPHHKHLSTLPHHKHDPDPSPSTEIEILDVFSYIANTLLKD